MTKGIELFEKTLNKIVEDIKKEMQGQGVIEKLESLNTLEDLMVEYVFEIGAEEKELLDKSIAEIKKTIGERYMRGDIASKLDGIERNTHPLTDEQQELMGRALIAAVNKINEGTMRYDNRITMGISYTELQEKLEILNEKWGLDFVSATAGNCCNTCGDMMTLEATKAWEKAETYLVVSWFFDGMNYCGAIEDFKELYIKYNIGKLKMDDVCKDIQQGLGVEYVVEVPEDDTKAIKIERVN